MPKTSVTLEQDIYDRWKASGVGLAELITRGLDVNDGRPDPAAGEHAVMAQRQQQDGQAIRDQLGRRIENLCVAVEGSRELERTLADGVKGLLTLLMQGYTLQPPGEKVVVLGPHEHTAEGPGECPRCQLLRDNPLFGASGGGAPGGGGGNGSGDVGGYSTGGASGGGAMPRALGPRSLPDGWGRPPGMQGITGGRPGGYEAPPGGNDPGAR